VGYQGIFEGKLLWSGQRITDFTIRELANMAYFYHVDMIQPPSSEEDPSVEEQIELFEEKIGQRVSATSKAEEMMRAGLIARGIDPDAKPEISPELAAKLEEDEMKSDTDIFFSGAMDREFRGRKFTDKDYKIE
jgi:hypothetical protein